MSDEVEEKLSKMGLEPKRIEGYQTASWILLDYYDVIVHIFLKETRDSTRWNGFGLTRNRWIFTGFERH